MGGVMAVHPNPKSPLDLPLRYAVILWNLC